MVGIKLHPMGCFAPCIVATSSMNLIASSVIWAAFCSAGISLSIVSISVSLFEICPAIEPFDVITWILPACLKRGAVAWFVTWLCSLLHACPASWSTSPFAHLSFVHLIGFFPISLHALAAKSFYCHSFLPSGLSELLYRCLLCPVLCEISPAYTNPWLSHVCCTLSFRVWWMNYFARHMMMGMMRQPRASTLKAVFASSLPSTCIVLPIRLFYRFVGCPSSSK